MSFRFVLFQSKGKPSTLLGCLLWYFDYNQGSFGSRYVLIKFGTLIGVEIRGGCPLHRQWQLNEWQRNVNTNDKHTPKHTLGNCTKSKVQEDARCPSCKRQFNQQQQQRRLKDDLILNLVRISREFRFIQFVYTVRDIPNRICKTAINFENDFKNCPRIVHFLSNVAISRCCFSMTFSKQRRRNEQRIITQAYTSL